MLDVTKTSNPLVSLESILPHKGAYLVYKACGGHISMDGFEGRHKDQPEKITNGHDKQKSSDLMKPLNTPEV